MIHLGDCLEVMRALDACSVDAVVTDPPYGIRFMGKAWDGADIDARAEARRACPSKHEASGPNGAHNSRAAEAGKYDLSPKGMRAFQEFSADWAREAIRVLKPGGYCVAFASPRTFHRMVCGLEEAGFEIRDTLMWLFGSGFPKSHNGEWGGTALKPAFEPIVLARKPLIGTVEANWRTHGTGALNIEGCRIATEEDLCGGAYAASGNRSVSQSLSPTGMNRPGATAGEFVQPTGRWPANVMHDGSPEVLAAFPDAPGQQSDLHGHSRDRLSKTCYGDMKAAPDHFARGDSGSAARFFYCAKATSADRHDGLPHPGQQFATGSLPRQAQSVESGRKGNHHPTVKPTALMRWLCRLVTPAGGVVLDPFAGSGSTGRAAVMEGMQFIGIELDREYAAIAEARIRAVQPGLALGVA